jgi:hypothetical protein
MIRQKRMISAPTEDRSATNGRTGEVDRRQHVPEWSSIV